MGLESAALGGEVRGWGSRWRWRQRSRGRRKLGGQASGLELGQNRLRDSLGDRRDVDRWGDYRRGVLRDRRCRRGAELSL